jgi:hypothetical protein
MSLPSVKFWHSEKATFAYCSVKNIFFVYFFFGECQILTLGKEYLCLVSILTLGNNYLCRVFFFFAECIWWLCRVPLWWGIWLAKISFLVVTWVYHHWVKIGYGGSSAGYNSLGNIQELLSKKIGKKNNKWHCYFLVFAKTYNSIVSLPCNIKILRHIC